MSDKYGESCPCCGTNWQITCFGKNVWKDCLKCEDKAENLLGKASKTTSSCTSTSRKYDGADWMVPDPHAPWPQSYAYGYGPSPKKDDDDWEDGVPF